jgi:hydroxypyruvate isomerase
MRYDVDLSILFTELPLLERPAAAGYTGYVGLEYRPVGPSVASFELLPLFAQ